MVIEKAGRNVVGVTHLNHCEDSAERDANHKNQKENSVKSWMPFCVENRQQNKSTASNEGAEDCKNGENAFPCTHRW